MPNLRVVHELVNDERVGNQRRLRKACRCGSSAVSLFIHMAWDCEQVCYGRMTLRKAKRGKEGICILLYQEGSCKRKTQLVITQFPLIDSATSNAAVANDDFMLFFVFLFLSS